METEALRQLTTEACTRLQGKLWPNRLGFDARRWEYCYSESRRTWQAMYRPAGYANGPVSLLGWGESPEAAQQYARWLSRHRARDPHCTCNDCIGWEAATT